MVVLGLPLALAGLGAAALVASGDLVVESRLPILVAALVGAVLLVAGLAYVAVRQIRVRSYLPPERYRGPAVVLLLVLVLVVGSVVTAPFGADAAAIFGGTGEFTALGSFVLLVATQVALLAVSWLFVFRPRALVGWPSWAGAHPAAALRSGAGWGVVAWLGSTAVGAVVALGMEALGMEVDVQTAERALRLVDPWIAVLAFVVLAPVAEEVFFRGVVYNAWLREGGPRLALIGSAALFAAIHFSVVALAPIFVLGLALAWIYRRTANLLAPIAMHATVNALSTALVLLARYGVLPVPA
jgi:membrane protease YdiL (CAAX protease family)